MKPLNPAVSITVATALAFALFGTAPAQDAPAPPEAPEGIIGDPVIADADATDVSVSELQQLVNLPSAVTIKEYQENLQSPPVLFGSQEEAIRLFKVKPPFIYFPEGVDPMIIPWVRERIVAQELFEEATVATANRDFDKSLDILKTLREKYPNTSEGQKAQEEAARVIALKESQGQPPGAVVDLKPPTQEGPLLPDWIGKNTSAILLTSSPVVLVGNDFLREGDPVPRYSGVLVKTISASEVVFSYQNKEFTIEVVGSF